ncbi:MAG: hypothetical protein R6V06_00090 [Kiritimatiellia bacterium]
MLSRVAALLRMKAPDQSASGLMQSNGATVPADGTAGYATACIFQHTDGGNGTALYVNEGTATSCSFKAVTTEA